MKSITCVLILGFASVTSFGQAQDSLKLLALENAVYGDMKLSGAPGAVVGVVRDGQIVYQKSFGLSNMNTQVPVGNSTVFHIGSITKVFTAAAVLAICEKNGIDIHSPVGNIVKGLAPRLSKVTVHQLLSHSSGIMDYWPNRNECRESVHEYFLSAGDNALFEEPGKVFSYSNNGYALAGLVLATLNNSSYPKAIEDILFKPLGMKNTTFRLADATTNFFAVGHMAGAAVPVAANLTSAVIQPAGGIFSNLSDMAKFASCIMNNGNYDSKQVLSAEVVKRMSGKYQFFGIQYQYLSYPNSHYGYGLINYTYKGIEFLGHSGETGSQNALMTMSPGSRTAVMVFSNAGYCPFINTLEKTVDMFVPVKPGQKENKALKPELKQTIGRYYSSELDKSKDEWIEIRLNSSNNLQVSFSDKRTFQLTQYENNRYRFQDPDFKFTLEIGFFANETGKIGYLNYFWRTYVKSE